MNKHILIIDDNPLHRELLKINIISNMPHVEVFESNNPKEAFRLLLDNKFDMILLDYNMPEMSGLEFLEKIEHTRRNTPIIMITGAGNEEVAAKAFKFGVTDYVVKSIDLPMKITKIIRDTLQNPKRKDQMSADLNSVEGGIRLINEYQQALDVKFNGKKIEEEILLEFESNSDYTMFSQWVMEQTSVKIKDVGFVKNKYAVLIIISPSGYDRII